MHKQKSPVFYRTLSPLRLLPKKGYFRPEKTELSPKSAVLKAGRANWRRIRVGAGQ